MICYDGKSERKEERKKSDGIQTLEVIALPLQLSPNEKCDMFISYYILDLTLFLQRRHLTRIKVSPTAGIKRPSGDLVKTVKLTSGLNLSSMYKRFWPQHRDQETHLSDPLWFPEKNLQLGSAV